MEKISWSPKIRQAKVRQLYENDARGTVDPVLVDQEQWRAAVNSMYARRRGQK